MAFTINPNDAGAAGSGGSGGSSNRRPDVRAGQKHVALVGMSYGESRAGNVKIDTCWMVVDDPDGGSDVRALLFDTFTLTQAAAWKLQQVAQALGQRASWDAEDEEATWKVLSQRPVLVEVAMEPKWNGDGERAAAQRYSTSSVTVDDAMDAQLGEAERWYTEWRKKKAGGGRQSRSRSGGGGAAYQTDDIPF